MKIILFANSSKNLINFRKNLILRLKQNNNLLLIIPKDDFLEEWLTLSRVGKITWYWSTINKSIKDDFDKIQNTKKYFIKLSDIDQNFDAYLSLVKRFNFENMMSKKQFYNVVNKASNKAQGEKYFYKNWSTLEKKEYEKIISEIFPYYDDILTNI